MTPDQLADLRYFALHFDLTITKGIKDFVQSMIFKNHANYLLIKDKEHPLEAFCTACGNVTALEDARIQHKKEIYCPALTLNPIACCARCHAIFKVIHAWRNHSLDSYGVEMLIDVYAKSLINKNAITCKTIHFKRTFGPDCRPRDTYTYRAMYLFEVGKKPVEYKLVWKWNSATWETNSYVVRTEKIKDLSLGSPYNSPYSYFHSYTDMDSFRKAIKGTPLKYCQYQKMDLSYYRNKDNDLLISYLALYCTHPLTELLIKMGLQKLVYEYLVSGSIQGTINWNVKKPSKLFKFKLTKADFAYLREHGSDVDSSIIKTVQEYRNIGSAITFKEAEAVRYCNQNKLHELISSGVTLQKIFAYCNKSSNRTFLSQRLRDWLDYIYDCDRLKIDYTHDKINLFPRNLERSHANLINQIYYERNAKIEAALQKTMPDRIKTFTFSSGPYLIRPVKSISELIFEGKVQHHCVGGYAQQYARQDTNILVLRKASNPDVPYFTMEVQDYEKRYILIQIRGNMNCDPPKDVKEFADKYIKQLNDKRREKVKVA